MKIGYARASEAEQNCDMQSRALLGAGCEVVYEDRGISAMARRRPKLGNALARLKPGDVLVIWKLDRLGRSLSHLSGVLQKLSQRNIGFQSLSESIDTTKADGWLVLHLIDALIKFQRSLTAERTRAGIAAAKERGDRVGRPRKLSAEQIKHAKALINSGEETVASVARALNVSLATLYRALSR